MSNTPEFLIRDDGRIYGYHPLIANHPRIRPHTPKEDATKEVITTKTNDSENNNGNGSEEEMELVVFDNLTKKQLLDLAPEGVEVDITMRKDDIIAVLKGE